MAGTISFSGLSASGLDTSSWVDALVSVKQQSVTSLEAQKTEQENLLSIVNNIKSYFSSFQSCLQKITDSQYGIASMDLFMQNLAISSNTNIATASATTEAARQSYDVAVDSLATATKATSGYSQFEVKTADLNTTFGTLGGKNGTITVNSQSFNVTTEDTLGTLVDKFKNVGVDASFDEKKGTFTVGIDLDKIDEGATNLKNALKLKNNNVSGAVSGSIVYANRNTAFSKLGLTAGKINIEGVEHTISKNGDNYTIQKTGGSAVQMNTLGDFLDYLKSSAVGAEDASVDGKGNITIKGATLDRVEGGSNLMDVLNLIESQKRTVSESGALSYIEVRNADLNTKLSALGVTGDTTLVAGGTSNTITNDKTLGDIQKILKNAGVEMSVDNRGVITIDTKGNEISGTLLDVLNLDPTKGGTTISSTAHQATLKAEGSTKLSELGVNDSHKYIAYKSDGTAVTAEMSNLSGKSINTLITDLKNVGLDASFDDKTHQIVIKDGYITGTLADVLGMTQNTTSYTENATLNTKLSALGATGDSTLSIDGGTAKTYNKDTTLETVFNDIKSSGGKVTFKDGNVTIEGVTLGGSVPALLGLDATTQGTSVTSGKLTAVTGSSSTGSGNNATVEHDIDLNSKIGDITGTSSSYTLKVGDGTSTTYTKDTTLQTLKTQIENAGGKFTINDDNTISIEGVTMSGTLVGALGFDEVETGTRFTTVNAVMISGTSNVATGGSTLGDLGLISGTSTHSAMRARGIATYASSGLTLSINGGTAKTYDSTASLDDIFADIVSAGGTASIDDEGYININGVHLEGTLVDKLGLVETDYKTTITSGNLKVTTSTSSTSSSVLYSDQKGDISWNSTIGSIVGDTNSYDLRINGTNNTFATNTKLSDIRTIIQNAGGTMTVNGDNTISINGVELSGSLFDKLGFSPNGIHTVISSNDPIYYTEGKKSADSGSTFEQLGIGNDKRDYAIYKNDGTLVKSSSTTGSSSGKTIGDWLKAINDSLNTANGTSGVNYATINDGVISITGGYVTGSLPTELGIGTTQIVTGITMEGNSVTYTEYDPLKYIGNVQTGSGVAGANMTSIGSIGAVVEYTDALGNVLQADKNTKLAEVLDTSGNKLGSGSFSFNVGSYTHTFDADTTTLGDIVNYINNLNTDTTYDTNTSASIVDGKISIESNVDITGTLMNALGFAKSDVASSAYEIKGDKISSVRNNVVESSSSILKSGYATTRTKVSSVIGSGYITIKNSSGQQVASRYFGSETIQDLMDYFNDNGITTTFDDSTNQLKFSSTSGNYAVTGHNVIYDYYHGIGLSNICLSEAESLSNGGVYYLSSATDIIALTKIGSTFSDQEYTFILTNDIDMSGLTNFGPGLLSNEAKVTFYGNGHVIKNFSSSSPLFEWCENLSVYDLGMENSSASMFGHVANGEIVNCYVTGSISSSDLHDMGGLANSIENMTVSNCYSTVDITSSRRYSDVGGLIGSAENSTITNCYVSGDVNASYASCIGGFIGKASACDIKNSFATGNVTTDSTSAYIGGFVARAEGGSINSSYAIGDTSYKNGTYNSGGFAGYLNSIDIDNCYASGSALGGFAYKASNSNISNSLAMGTSGLFGGGCFLEDGNYTFGNNTITNCQFNGTRDEYNSATATSGLTAPYTYSTCTGFKTNNTYSKVADGTPTMCASSNSLYVSENADENSVIDCSGTITVVKNGVESTISILDTDTFGELISKLGDYGFTASLTDGKLKIEGSSSNLYIKSMDSALASTLNLSNSLGSTATTSTTIKDLMGKSGSQTLTLTPTAGGSQVELTFNDTDTIQTVIDKLKAQGIDEADITDGIFRIKDDKQWTISGALANKLFGGADDVYTYTGNKVTYTTINGDKTSQTGDQLTYTTSTGGGSITGDSLTYTISTGGGSKTGNKLTYTTSTGSTTSKTSNKVTYQKSTTYNNGYKYTAADFNKGSVYRNTFMSEFSFHSYDIEDKVYSSPEGKKLSGRTITGINNSGESFSIDISDNMTIEVLDNSLRGNGFAITQLETGLWGIVRAGSNTRGSINIPDEFTYKGSSSHTADVLATLKVTVEETNVTYNATQNLTANNSTSLSDLALSSTIKVDGTSVTGLSSSSTVSDVLSALKNQFGIDGSISDGKITLTSSASHTVSGDIINKFFGSDSITLGGGSTQKTYTGSKVTATGRVTGYSSDTKLVAIESSWLNETVAVRNHEGTDRVSLKIDQYTTISDIERFFSSAYGVTAANYDEVTGKMQIVARDGYSVSEAPFNTLGNVGSTMTFMFGTTNVMSSNFTLDNLGCSAAISSGDKLSVTNNGISKDLSVSTSTQVSDIISFLQSAGCTATITDGVLTVTGGEDLAFSGNSVVWNKLFGGSIPTPTTSSSGSGGGTSTTQTATGSTTLSQLGITDFTINGEALSGITGSSTIDETLSAIKTKYGVDGSITNGEVTMSADTSTTLSGGIINKFFGSDSITLGGGSTQKTYTGSKVTTSTSSSGYSSSTKLANIDSGYLGQTIRAYNGGFISNPDLADETTNPSTGTPSTSVIGQTYNYTIDNNTTIQDVIDFLKLHGTTDVSYFTGTGELSIKVQEGWSVTIPFAHDIVTDGSTTTTYSIGTKNSASAHTMTTTDTLEDLGLNYILNMPLTVTNNGISKDLSVYTSTQVSDIISFLQSAGCTATITDGVLTVTGGEDLAISGNPGVWNTLFGGSIPTPTTSTGGDGLGTVHCVATGSTTLSQLGITDFTINGEALSGITGSSTIDETLAAIKTKYGVDGSISAGGLLVGGKITMSADTSTTLSGAIINRFFGQDSITLGGGSTQKTYTGSKVTVGALAASGYSADTKLVSIKSNILNKRISVKSDNYTGSTTGYPSQSMNFRYMDITNTTTIQDVVDFLSGTQGVSDVSYNQTTGEVSYTKVAGWTVSVPFQQNFDDSLDNECLNCVFIIGKAGGSSGHTMTGNDTLSDLDCSVTLRTNTVTVTNNGTSKNLSISATTKVSELVSFLQSAGCTATITDGVLTVTGSEDLAFSGNYTVWNKLFGGSIPTPTTSTGGDGLGTVHCVATGSTTLSQLGITDFTINGEALSGITGSSTIDETLAAIKTKYGVDGSISAGGLLVGGKITMSADTSTTLSGAIINRFFGQDSITLGTSTTQTATVDTALGDLGLSSFDLKVDGASITGLSATSKISDVFDKLAEKNITATISDGKITLTSNSAATLSGTVAEKLLGSSSVTLAGGVEHVFNMSQISATKSLYTSRALTYNSGAQRVSEVTELVAGGKYHIASADDIKKLADFVKNGADTTGSIFVFDNDIDMSGVTGFTGIGASGASFKGTVYGNGHVVKNLNIDSTASYTTTTNIGLFGYVEGATIQDLGVVDAYVIGGGNSGILVGYAKNAKLSNLYTTGYISGANSFGGLVGAMVDSVGEKLYSTATVTSTSNGSQVGGLVGYLENSVLQTVYATGDVSAYDSVGGLVGKISKGGTIKNAYATGNISGTSNIGGLVGQVLGDSSSYTIDTVYSTGRVTGSSNIGGLIGLRGSSSLTITNAIYNTNAISSAVGSGSANGITGKTYAEMIDKSVMQNAGFTEAKGWVLKDNATPTFGNVSVSGGGKVYLDDSVTSFVSGSAYYISSIDHLNKLASLVRNGADTTNISFILENDIDVSTFSNYIGSSVDEFKGTFYGNGHTLTGLTTNLFGYVGGNAVIRDLGLENMNGGNLASTVGGNSTIDNVYSTGSATVAGLVCKLVSSATIKNSYSTANVISNGWAGGLVAAMYGNATIENSFATGNVNGVTFAGGLVGIAYHNSSIKSSYATGNVTSTDYNSGGLVGTIASDSTEITIQNSYASGSATGGFIGNNAGTVNSSGNVYNSANSSAVGSGSSISGLTALSLNDMKSQATMEALGFTKDNGWNYYAGKTPMLQAKDTTTSRTEKATLDTIVDSILNVGYSRNVLVTINGTTYEKEFNSTDTIKDVRDWLNSIDGVTATFDESDSTLHVSGEADDFKIRGDVANALFGGNKTTTKTNGTINTDSNELLFDSEQKKITTNTTVGQLLGKKNGDYTIAFYDDNGNVVTETFGVDKKLSDVLQFLQDNGFQASISDGVFTATKDGRKETNIFGTIGNKLKGDTGTVTKTDSGYQTGVLGSSSSTKATASTKLSELGIDSGSILIKDNNNNNLGTIQINNSMTIDDTAQLLANYGFTLTITDGKVTITGDATNRLADGTSNMVSTMKLDNWTGTKDKLETDSTVAQMGFGKGATLSLILDNKTYNLKFDATDTLQDIIDTLGNYGVTASVDSNGKFTASANGNLVLSNELGAYLTKNSAEGYVKEANGYKSKDPLEFSGDKVKLDYDSTVGDILGTGNGGVLRLTLNNSTVVDLKYNANETMNDIIADLKGYGITATIEDGVLKAVSEDKTFRFSGEIGKIISGDTPLYEDVSTGYKSKDLSYTTTDKANMNNTLKEMGISSGQIHVLSNDGKIVSTLDVDESYTVAQVKSLLQPFGMDLSIDADGKVTVTSSEGYKLSDGTSNMVSTMKLNNWTTTTEKLTGTTTLSQMGFKDGADLNLFLDGTVMNILSFDSNQTLNDIIFALSAYGIDASVNADGQFTATSKSHTFIMSSGLGSYLTNGTGGYVNSSTGYQSYKPLTEEHPYVVDNSKELTYNKLMTSDSTLESLGFAQGGSVRVMLDGTTPYSLEFLATDTVQDVIYALSAYGINAEVKDGKFVADSINNTFTLTGNFGSYIVQGGNYQNEVTGYESSPLTYNTTEKLTNDTKLSDLGIAHGNINIIKEGKVSDTINITDDTTIGQLFSAIKPYGMTGEIVTDASGNTSIRISADSEIKLADGTSNVVSGLGLHDVRKGDFEGHREYWEDNATSGLITEDMLLSSLDKNGFIAQGSLIFTTGEGDDAVQHIINITANETVGSLLKKLNNSGLKAELDNGVIKLTAGLDKLTFSGGTSGLVNTIGLDIKNIDKYASSSSALTYEGETHYSASNFANANTTLDIVNATDGIMSIFVDGIKCNVEVKSSETFAELFKKVKDSVKAKTGMEIEVGFMTKDGSISATPVDSNNTGIVAFSIAQGHELVVGASNDTTNFATIANLNKTDYNSIAGSRALYRVNVNSLITQSGLYRDGDITEGTFTIGDAEFTIDSNTTLASLINQINKNDKAYANAYWDTLSGTLVIQSTNTGASLINIEAGTSNFTDIMGFTRQKDGVSALVTDSQTLGQNAVVRINGTTVTSATNVITSDISRIKGLTINLKNVSAGETVTISVEQDKESIYNAVSDTLDSYNAMMEALNKELSDRNSLGGESILKLMRNSLKRLMTSSLTGAYVFKNLASVGISTGEASDSITTNVTSLLIDKDKFMDALATDSDAVQDLLVGTKANPGIFLQANNIVESSIKTDGYFSNMANTLTKSINNIEKKITKTNTAIENYRAKLQTKFHNMELTISGLQSAYANLLN